jgi:TolA-binding protein
MIDLDEATRALRDESDGASVGAPQTRARIMRSLHEGTHRRRVRWGFGVPLAVVFAGSTAFAGARGDLGETVQEAFSSVRALVTGAPAETPRSAAPSRGSVAAAPPPVAPAEPPEAAPAAPPEPAVALPETEPLAPSPAQVRGVPTPPTSERRAAPTPEEEKPRLTAPAEAPSTNAPTESNEATRLYRKAHEAQFVQADCESALSAYDAYLTSAPRDRLVPEARYNRALCLVRLGRTGAARSALQPFADGAYGDFRRREARELLDALGGR